MNPEINVIVGNRLQSINISHWNIQLIFENDIKIGFDEVLIIHPEGVSKKISDFKNESGALIAQLDESIDSVYVDDRKNVSIGLSSGITLKFDSSYGFIDQSDSPLLEGQTIILSKLE